MRVKRLTSVMVRFVALVLLAAKAPAAFAQQSQTPGGSAVRLIGAIQAIHGSEITLKPDSGSDVKIAVAETTRVVRIAPGEKDLKNAQPIALQDLQMGDRILVAGKASENNQPFLAASVVVMKRSDLEARNQQNLQDWHRRGIDGIVRVIDPAAGTVTISSRSKDLVIHTSSSTVIRHYAPDSVKFDDAKPGKLEDIQPDDQIRARGERSQDGTQLDSGGNCFRILPQHRRNYPCRGPRIIDAHGSRSGEEGHLTRKSHSGFATSPVAAGVRPAYGNAPEGWRCRRRTRADSVFIRDNSKPRWWAAARPSANTRSLAGGFLV